MISFKDTLGRQWICRVDIAAIRRARALCNIDLANSIAIHQDGTVATDAIRALADDPCLLVDTIFAVVKDQADKQNIDAMQFAEGMDGDTIEAATMALMEGIVEFFPLAKRQLLAKILETVKRQRRENLKAFQTMTQNGTLDNLIDSALAPSPTLSPPAPASSASTPPPSPSGN
jgi:hypothetical protein